MRYHTAAPSRALSVELNPLPLEHLRYYSSVFEPLSFLSCFLSLSFEGPSTTPCTAASKTPQTCRCRCASDPHALAPTSSPGFCFHPFIHNFPISTLPRHALSAPPSLAMPTPFPLRADHRHIVPRHTSPPLTPRTFHYSYTPSFIALNHPGSLLTISISCIRLDSLLPALVERSTLPLTFIFTTFSPDHRRVGLSPVTGLTPRLSPPFLAPFS
jgi:hypothetical protein